MTTIPARQLRPGDHVVDASGHRYQVAHIDRLAGWAFPIAFDDAGWALAIGHDLVVVDRAA